MRRIAVLLRYRSEANTAPVSAAGKLNGEDLTGLYGVTLGETRGNLDDVFGRGSGRWRIRRALHRAARRLAPGHAARRHGLSDGDDSELLVEPDDVERDAAVLHPERVLTGLFENEEHALVFGEFLAEHQAPLALRFGICDFQRHDRAVAERRAGAIERTLTGRRHHQEPEQGNTSNPWQPTPSILKETRI